MSSVIYGEISYFYWRIDIRRLLQNVTRFSFWSGDFKKENTAETICRIVFVPGSACIYTGNRAEDSLTCDFI